MANQSPDDVEILVHITAPSRAADDVAYRQQAQAYLDFQAQTSSNIQLTDAKTRQLDDSRRKQTSKQTPTPLSELPTSTPVQAFEINSQDISFRSALDNRSSPRLLYTATRNAGPPSSQESGVRSQISWCPPSSEISDSYPMPEADLLQVSPSRVLRHYIGRPNIELGRQSSPSHARKRRRPESSDPDRVDVPSSLPATGDEAGSVRTPGFIQSHQTILVTPPTTGVVAQTLGKAQEHSGAENPDAASDIPPDITHISSSGISSQSAAASPRAESEPPPTKRAKVGHLQHGDLVRSSSDTGPVPSSSNPTLELFNSALEILPPSPPVGVSDIDPDGMVPPKFAKLASDLSSRYRPEAKRAVDPLERGYWLLDCSAWSPESRFGAWVFLNNYLRSGLAGWGTWCRRDQTHDWIRLYCWGHVAKHTYLLLYLASERHLKTTGAGWYDAEGKLILEVLPHDK